MKLPPELTRFQSSVESSPKVFVRHHGEYTVGETTGGLGVIFAVLCIVDLFGVFPIIALPKSIISCGIYGVPMVMAMAGLQLYTAALLGKCWLLAQQISPEIIEQNRSPYAAVANLAFGVPARRIVTFLIDATVFGSGVPNFIFASQSLQIFCWKITGGNVGITYCVWMVLLGLLLCPVMWLGSPKDMKPLAMTSFFIVSTVAICTWTCILLDDVSPPSDTNFLEYRPGSQNFLIAYGILAFQFDIHPMLLTIQVDMKDSKKVNLAVLGGFAITGSMFMVTTLLMANRYGFNVNNNILETIPPSIPLYLMALLVTLQLCLSNAVGNSALFQHIEGFLKIPREFGMKRCVLRSGIVAIAIFLGETVPRFDLVMGLVGSTLTGPLMFVCPPLFFLKLCYINSIKDKKDILMGKTSRNGDVKRTTIQNGDVSLQNGSASLPLAYTAAFQTQYNTFNSDYITTDSQTTNNSSIKWYDMILALIVMCLGVSATLLATYTSWADSIKYAEFSPPCLINATIAARSFLY